VPVSLPLTFAAHVRSPDTCLLNPAVLPACSHGILRLTSGPSGASAGVTTVVVAGGAATGADPGLGMDTGAMTPLMMWMVEAPYLMSVETTLARYAPLLTVKEAPLQCEWEGDVSHGEMTDRQAAGTGEPAAWIWTQYIWVDGID